MSLTTVEWIALVSLLSVLVFALRYRYCLRVLQSDYHELEQNSAVLKTEAAVLKTEVARLDQRYVDLDVRYQKEHDEFDDLSQRHFSLNSEFIVLKTSLDERDKQHENHLALIAEQKQSLEKEFQNLANRIFEEKGKSFSLSSQHALEGLLKPFREQISEFRLRVDGIHKENNESTGSLKKELEQLRELNKSMTNDAQNLTSALKGDKKKVGLWGEVQLEKTLQMAGLVQGEHYHSQAHFKDANGKHNFPDFVINLPDGKHIIIDSKVSLLAYTAAVSATTEVEQEAAMKEHIQCLKNHVNGLSGKDYSKLLGIDSPSFVLMFLPIEPAYIEAMRFSHDLFDYAYRQGIVLVSHSTLMPILKTVSNLWVLERSHAGAREMGERAGDIYNQVCLLADRLNKLGGTMQTASKQYNSVVVALAGQQGLHGKVERFSHLSIEATKIMPVIEPIHADIDSERLNFSLNKN